MDKLVRKHLIEIGCAFLQGVGLAVLGLVAAIVLLWLFGVVSISVDVIQTPAAE